MIKRISLALSLLFFHAVLKAQENGGTKMADEMRRNGKIFVVAAVLLTILLGLILYLVRLDRKISKLEKHINSSS
jgi:tRNA(Phe) wybutosine-synthesizing methylase Tyw3